MVISFYINFRNSSIYSFYGGSMKRILTKLFFAYFIIIAISVYAANIPFTKPAGVDEEIWLKVQPYLLPTDHPMRNRLDKIFRFQRATHSGESMKHAGFKLLPLKNKRKIVAKHSKLKGYLVKTYLDDAELDRVDGLLWIHRIKGARQIQECIHSHGYDHLMKTPKKWLYPLPDTPMPAGPFPRKFILLVEDMEIVPKEMNRWKYFQETTPELLDALYLLLSENLLIDSIHINNIPFCKDGRIAFIDTEYFNTTRKPVRYSRLISNLSPQMQEYMQGLVNQGEIKSAEK